MMENKTKIDLKNKSIFITGVAGFIGSNLAKRLLSTVEGVKVVGLDNMNHYYDVRLKEARLNELEQFENFSFVKGNLADKAVIESIKSDVFAKVAAGVFAANGVKVNIWPVLMPVPTVSFATRYLHTSAGVMVTASHNPSKYNGYKVYGADGCQITTEAAAEILAEIEKLDIFADVKTSDFEAGVANGSILDDPVLLKFMAVGYHFPVGYAIINSTKHHGEGPTWSNDAFVHTVCRSWKRGRSSVPTAAGNLQGATRRAVFRQAPCWQAGIPWATSRAWTARASSTGAWRTTALSG